MNLGLNGYSDTFDEGQFFIAGRFMELNNTSGTSHGLLDNSYMKVVPNPEYKPFKVDASEILQTKLAETHLLVIKQPKIRIPYFKDMERMVIPVPQPNKLPRLNDAFFGQSEASQRLSNQLNAMMEQGEIWDVSVIEKNFSDVDCAQIVKDAEKNSNVTKSTRRKFIEKYGKLKKSDLFFNSESPEVNELLNKLQLNELFEDDTKDMLLKVTVAGQNSTFEAVDSVKRKSSATSNANFNTPEVVRKIMRETHQLKFIAESMAERLNKTNKQLHPKIEKWINGEEQNFIFNDISLKEIMEKENVSYIRAILTMDTLLNSKSPDAVKSYKTLKIKYR
ncbi:MAG: hypothetical protein LBH62_01420 [Nitrososphaerota archaeon]|jgi:hypothetical protein|nr:hypothetical protein [Nitrososphaerota archaeon]